MKTYLALVLLMGLLLSGPSGALTYVAPPLGRLVFNEIIDPAAAVNANLPLRLPKTGNYYAELILEPVTGVEDVELTAPLVLDLDFAFRRHQRLLHNAAMQVQFAPGERVKTLFWLEVPHELPDRTALAMAISLRELSHDQLKRVRLRLQVTRKLEMLPLILR